MVLFSGRLAGLKDISLYIGIIDMANRFKDNKLLSFLVIFFCMAAAFIAFYVFFDWFYCIAVKKENFEFVFQRHVIIPAVLALVYSVVMQTKVFDKDAK